MKLSRRISLLSRTAVCAALTAVLLVGSPLYAQSTQGLFLGTVHDSTGSAVSGAAVIIISHEEGVVRNFLTDDNGNFRAPDFKPGGYRIEVRKDGFKTAVHDFVPLVARQQLRQDFVLEVGTVSETVEVKDILGSMINTESALISDTFDSTHVLDLPVNNRAGGSTSPLSIVQSLPGVQADSSGKFSVQGGLPFMSETSVDGITTQNVGNNNPLSDAWPSTETIGELRVDGVGNSAEFGQPGAITSVSKNGTNAYHGSLFWYHQNRALDATAYGQTSKPQKIGNDFGFSGGGPLSIPAVYNGHDRTFFYGTYENFRFPKAGTVYEVVPTAAMRGGDFSNVYNVSGAPIAPLNNPFASGTTYANNIITSPLSANAQTLLSLFPLPNYAGTPVTAAGGFDGTTNFIQNVNQTYHSNQFDIRVDQYVNSRFRLFGRYTWKNIDQVQPVQLLIPNSTYVDQYRMMVLSATYDFNPRLSNEFRFGFTRNNNGLTNPFGGQAFAQQVNLTGIPNNNLYFDGVTETDFNSITSLNAGRLNQISQSNVYQFTDNLSWTHGRHTLKFGGDIRHIQAVSPLGFNGADNYGTFDFSAAMFTGNDFADFLLGLPSATFFDTVRQDNDGRTTYYNFYGEDTWQLTPRLTMSYGLRYEFHPGYVDASGNIGNFDPSAPLSGRAIYPDGGASLLDPGYLASFNACPNLTGSGPVINGAPCTPVLSASQAGLPESLRTSSKLRFVPRLAFAYRPFNNDKTVFRAGLGAFNITTLGRIFYALTGTIQAGTQAFQNQETSTGPLYQWPAINNGGTGYGAPQYGTAYFGTANNINFKDPLAYQWSFSVDHEFHGGLAVRASYMAMRTNYLVWATNYNDMSYSSTVAAVNRPLTDRPFPNWGTIQNRDSSANSLYNSFQLEANRRLRNGLTFNSSYTWAKNMADNQAHQMSFADENGGSRATYNLDRSIDYGPVYGTRRHRWLTTAIYELPIGKGHTFGDNWNKSLNAILGGWQLSNIFLWQSGPYLTPYFRGGDPSGTGSGTLWGRSQYADQVANWVPANQGAGDWISPGSFVCPGMPSWTPGSPCTIGTGSGPDPLPIGRFGNARTGSVIGPGMVNLSTGLSKEFAWSERAHFKIGASFTNILNHTNLADPNLNIASGNFGRIDSARGSDFGGSRTGQVFARFEF